jgi:glycine cleavage system H protein
MGVVMESSKSQNVHPLVPSREQKCVWMTAGILSYQLCDRQFECDHCPLDSALRTLPHRDVAAQEKEVARVTSAEKPKLVQGYLYSKKHSWLRQQGEGVFRIGLEPYLSSMILDAKTVVLPSVGDHVQANAICSWVVTEGGTLQITSPVEGDVSDVNSRLIDQPHDLCLDSLGRGWLFELKTGEEIFNRAGLFQVAEAERIYGDDVMRFQSLVLSELKRHRTAAGMTLPDGGQPVQHVSAMLGPEKYFRLLKEVFS